jgi:hypothetical protein
MIDSFFFLLVVIKVDMVSWNQIWLPKATAQKPSCIAKLATDSTKNRIQMA